MIMNKKRSLGDLTNHEQMERAKQEPLPVPVIRKLDSISLDGTAPESQTMTSNFEGAVSDEDCKTSSLSDIRQETEDSVLTDLLLQQWQAEGFKAVDSADDLEDGLLKSTRNSSSTIEIDGAETDPLLPDEDAVFLQDVNARTKTLTSHNCSFKLSFS